jgi:hypothetical protein
LLGLGVERRNAHEDVRGLLKYSLLGEFQKGGTDSLIPEFRFDAYRLDESNESTPHMKDHETDDFLLEVGYIRFPCWIGQHLQAKIVVSAQGYPRLGAGHEPGAFFCFFQSIEFSYFKIDILHLVPVSLLCFLFL